MDREPTPLMRRIEAREGQPIEAILAALMRERPRLTLMQMAVRLGVAEKTLRNWAEAFGARRVITWSIGHDDGP